MQIILKYFSYLLEKYEKPSLALAAYNAGFGNVDNWIKDGIIKSDGSDYENIPYKETNMYVRIDANITTGLGFAIHKTDKITKIIIK